MTRVSQIVWPVAALVASFVAVFALTAVFANPRTPADKPSEPTQTEQASPSPATETLLENVLVIEVRGVKRLPAGSSTREWPEAVLEVSAEEICLAKEFTDKGWSPEGSGWSTPAAGGRLCRPIESDQPVNLKFVKHE